MHHSAGGSGQPCLVPDRKRTAFSPSLFSVMLGAVFCINCQILCCDSFAESFRHQWVFNFVRCFSASIEMTTWFSFL